MEKKQHIPVLYIILYRMIKDSSVNDVIDLGTIKFVLGRHHIKKSYHKIVIKELSNYGFISKINGKSANTITVYDLPENKLLDNTSKLYRYVGCY